MKYQGTRKLVPCPVREYDELPQLMRTKDIMRLLHASETLLYALRNDTTDPLPCSRIGKQYYYDKDLFQAWFERRTYRAVGLPTGGTT